MCEKELREAKYDYTLVSYESSSLLDPFEM